MVSEEISERVELVPWVLMKQAVGAGEILFLETMNAPKFITTVLATAGYASGWWALGTIPWSDDTVWQLPVQTALFFASVGAVFMAGCWLVDNWNKP